MAQLLTACTRRSSKVSSWRLSAAAQSFDLADAAAARPCCGDRTDRYASSHAHALCRGANLASLPGAWIVLDRACSAADAAGLHDELQRLPRSGDYGGNDPSRAHFRRAIGITRGDDIFHIHDNEASAAGFPKLAKAVALLKAIAHEVVRVHGSDLTVAPRARALPAVAQPCPPPTA